jgi:protein-tyrosine sulfotransferase
MTQIAALTAPGADSAEITSFADPVFVLWNGRSGSTLLRFLLDAHPDLACPPETNLPDLCAQLATVWSLIEGAPLSVNRGDEPPEIPDAAISGIRQTMDRMVGSYLARRGKKRYCDKSLGTAQFAELLLRVYPEAKFLCLYRHPMDVIASAIEACPWGLNGYGFDPYVATTPGNAVMAVARFWVDNAAAILAVEDEFADRCLRVRYEDLVTEPESVAAQVFEFLDAAPAPGISEACFSAERERFGPADYKIWFTTKISSESVGRGWSAPAAMIAPPILAAMNDLADKLGYLPVDDEWGTKQPPRDLRVPVMTEPESKAAAAASAGEPLASQVADRCAAGHLPAAQPAESQLLGERLRAGIADAREQSSSRWERHAGEIFVAVWIPTDPNQAAEHWLVNLNEGAVSFASRAAQEHSDWDIVGAAEAWQQVMSGRLNLNVALRACQLRYCDGDESSPLASAARISILAALLGITSW